MCCTLMYACIYTIICLAWWYMLLDTYIIHRYVYICRTGESRAVRFVWMSLVEVCLEDPTGLYRMKLTKSYPTSKHLQADRPYVCASVNICLSISLMCVVESCLMCTCVYMYVHRSICFQLSVYLYTHLYVCLSIYIHTYIDVSICL